MKLINFIIILLLITNSSCTKNTCPRKERLKNKVISQTSQELKTEKQLILVGFGGSSLQNFEHISISFDCYQPLNIKKARKIILFIANRFLNNINDVLKKNQEDLYEIKNLKIMIFCYMPNKSPAKPPNLGSIWLIKNNIYYNLREEDLKTIHKETYKEALEIVESNKPTS